MGWVRFSITFEKLRERRLCERCHHVLMPGRAVVVKRQDGCVVSIYCLSCKDRLVDDPEEWHRRGK